MRLVQEAVEAVLAVLNRRYWSDPRRQDKAASALRLSPEEMGRSLAYAVDRHRFGLASAWIHAAAGLVLLATGGLGLVERWAVALASRAGLGPIGAGLAFFALLGAAGSLFELPFGVYATFVIEERHGFNRQTLRGFFLDVLKGVAVSAALGGLLLLTLLALMERAGAAWWLWAWAAVTAFSILAAWIYPTLLAPLFNRFTPLPRGELRDRIEALAAKIGFRTSGVFVMDASRRSAHGNAYFAGLFRAKRIVLFDTLLEGLAPGPVVAVLAHELGHFKLHHVRAAIARSVAVTGLYLYLVHVCLPLAPLYQAFALRGVSSYGALVVFSLWFGLVGFALQPVASWLSRRNEFAADAFAVTLTGGPRDLGDALLALREKSHALPLSHPLFSRIYHSHPPLLERLEAIGF